MKSSAGGCLPRGAPGLREKPMASDNSDKSSRLHISLEDGKKVVLELSEEPQER